MRTRIEVDLKKGNALWVFVAIWLLVGGAFLYLGISTALSFAQFKKTALEASARITEIEEVRSPGKMGRTRKSHRIYIEYEVNGQAYAGILSYYTSSMNVGGAVKIYYDPQNPGEIRSAGDNIFTLIPIGLGSAALTLGLACIAVRLRIRRGKRADPADMRSYNSEGV